MKRLFAAFLGTAMLLLSSCSEFDDTAIWEELNDHTERIEKLEQLCSRLNNNVEALYALVEALDTHDYVVSVVPVVEDGKEVGYTITFARSGSVTIYHGADGKPGTDGTDGEDGEDGHTPIVGVKKDKDGIYYWTLDGEWLLDKDGKKIRVDGEDGVDGVDGKDGVIPQLKIERGYWYISYDNGVTWKRLDKATGEDGRDGLDGVNGMDGEDGKDGVDGKDGEDGRDGVDGDSFFQEVRQDEANVYIILKDGTEIIIPKIFPLSIEFETGDWVPMDPNSKREIEYTVQSVKSRIDIEVVSSADIKASVVKYGEKSGHIKVETSDDVNEYSKVVVFVSDGEQLIMRTLTFEDEGIWISGESIVEVSAEGAENIWLYYIANAECEVIIPKSADWIHLVSTKAFEEHHFVLSVDKNSGESRTADITVRTQAGMSVTYTINQKPNPAVQGKLDREALIAIYKALDGPNWEGRDNWCTDKPLGEWEGVGTSDECVTYLHLDGYAKGTMPDEIYDLVCLESLDVYSSELEWEIKPEIAELKNLHYLRSDAKLMGTIPLELHSMESLRSICLYTYQDGSDCRWDFKGIENLARLYEVRAEGVYVDNLSNICNATNLEYLSLRPRLDDGNDYFEIPREIGNLSKLRDLYMGGCGLSGTIPASLGQCTNLTWLNLESNNLTGAIPPELGYLTKLHRLCLRYNQLQGEIPESVRKQPFWEYSWGDIVYGNNFTFNDLHLEGPDFEVTDVYGNVINSNDQYKKNEYTILYQWWEEYYDTDFRREMVKVYETFKDKGVEIIGWSFQEEDIIRSLNLPWINFRCEWPNYFFEGESGYYNTYPADPWWSFVTIVDSNKNVVYSNLLNNEQSVGDFLSGIYGVVMPDDYVSTDYSADGASTVLQQAEIGNGIDIVLMGDAYSDREIASGKYENVMMDTYKQLFSIEPYKTFRDYFNVYQVNVVSHNEGYFDGSVSALSTWFGGGTFVGGDDGRVFEYARNVISEDRMDEALIVVMMNIDAYAGTCWMYYPSEGDYGNGPSIAYFPTSRDTETFNGLIHHEANGHGFAKLADEYAYEGYIQQGSIDEVNYVAPFGWYRNIDFTNDYSTIKWSRFLNDPRYANEGLGAFEGGFTYSGGVWRPTEDSIMRYNVGVFNAPSREAIYNRIHKLAFGEAWEYDYESFVEYDTINRNQKSGAPAYLERPKDFVPTAPPVIRRYSWREAVNKSK